MSSKFIKVGIIYGTSTVLKMLIGIITIKLISFYLGTEGLGQLGQFMSIMTIVSLLAGGAISTGIVRNISASKNDELVKSLYLKASFVIWAWFSLIVFIILIWQSSYLSEIIFNRSDYYYVFIILAFAQAGIGLYNIFINIINAYQDVYQYAIISFMMALIGAIILWFLIYVYGISGAIIGLLVSPLIGSILSLFIVFKKKYLSINCLKVKAKLPQYKSLFAFSIMLVVSACTIPIVQIILRDWIATDLGWHYVGIWQGMVKLSDVYLQFITIVLANYYLPRLSEKNNFNEIHKEMILAIRTAIIILIPLTFFIWIIREWVILILFSNDFLEMKELFLPQLIGDIFKILAYIIGYIAVSKGLTFIYVIAEILQSTLILLLTNIFLIKFSIQGVIYASTLTYFIYLIICLSVYWFYYKKMNKEYL